MRSAAAVNECPICGSTIFVKNGRPGDQQQYRCRSQECGSQFFERTDTFRQRLPAEVIARAIELRLEGMSYDKIAAEIRRRFSMSDTEIPAATVLRWVNRYISWAAGEVRKLTVKVDGPLSVEYASLYPTQGGCWLVLDLSTYYVLAAQAGSPFDAAMARQMMIKSIEPIGPLSGDVYNFTFGADGTPGEMESISDVLEAFKQPQPPFGRLLRPEEMGPEYFPFLGIRSAFREPLRTMRKRRTFRSPESRQVFLNGWVITHNFFIQRDDLDGRKPAEEAGVEAPFRSWAEVVKHRARVSEYKPRTKGIIPSPTHRSPHRHSRR